MAINDLKVRSNNQYIKVPSIPIVSSPYNLKPQRALRVCMPAVPASTTELPAKLPRQRCKQMSRPNEIW